MATKILFTTIPENMAWTMGICMNGRGYHISKNLMDTMQFSGIETIAKVQVRGRSVRILKAWEWNVEDSVSLAEHLSNDLKEVSQKLLNLTNFFTLTKKIVDGIETPHTSTFSLIGTMQEVKELSEDIKIKCHDFIISRLKGKKSLENL